MASLTRQEQRLLWILPTGIALLPGMAVYARMLFGVAFPLSLETWALCEWVMLRSALSAIGMLVATLIFYAGVRFGRSGN